MLPLEINDFRSVRWFDLSADRGDFPLIKDQHTFFDRWPGERMHNGIDQRNRLLLRCAGNLI